DDEHHAVAQFPGIGDLVGAVGAGIVVGDALQYTPEIAAAAKAAERVGVRFGVAEGEAGPLDERARHVRRERAPVEVVHAQHDYRPQRAVGSLRAAVEADVASALHGVLAGGPIMRAGGAIERDVTVA